MNQIDTVLQQLRGGPITSLQMIQRFGITRLATHIYVLRQDGFRIRSENVTVLNRFGAKCEVALYTLLNRRRGGNASVRRLRDAQRARRQVAVIPTQRALKPGATRRRPPTKRQRAKGRV